MKTVRIKHFEIVGDDFNSLNKYPFSVREKVYIPIRNALYGEIVSQLYFIS